MSFEQKSDIHLPSFSTGPVQMKSTMALSVDEIKINLHTANLQDSSAAVLAGWLFLTLPSSHPPSLPPTCLDHFPGSFPHLSLWLCKRCPQPVSINCSSLPNSLPPFQPCAHASSIGITPGWLPRAAAYSSRSLLHTPSWVAQGPSNSPAFLRKSLSQIKAGYVGPEIQLSGQSACLVYIKPGLPSLAPRKARPSGTCLQS